MRSLKLTTTAVVMVAFFALFLNMARAEQPTWASRWQTARFKTLEWPDDKFSAYENRLTVAAAARLFDVNEGRMICIVDRESGWNEHAQNPTSTAAGLWQFVVGTWASSSDHYLSHSRDTLTFRSGASRMNSRAATLVAASMLSRGQWQHWGPGEC